MIYTYLDTIEGFFDIGIARKGYMYLSHMHGYCIYMI